MSDKGSADYPPERMEQRVAQLELEMSNLKTLVEQSQESKGPVLPAPFPEDDTWLQDHEMEIKASFGDDIRRLKISKTASFYNIHSLMKKTFENYLNTWEDDYDVVIKYKDDEGDLVTIVNNTDFKRAIRVSPIPRFVISRKKRD